MLMYDVTPELIYDQPAECPHGRQVVCRIWQPWWTDGWLREWVDHPRYFCLDCGEEVIDVQ